jgi:hypothetical protein
MTSNPFSDDSSSPYRPPTADRELPVYARRPGGLTAVCVLAIILGFLALGSAFGTTCGVVMNLLGGVGGMFSSGMGGELEEIQVKMYREVAAFSNQFVVIHVLIILLLVVLGTALLVGGFRSMKLIEAGRRTLVAACSAAILFEIVRCGWMLFEQMQTMAIMRTNLSRITDSLADGAGPARAMQGIMSVSLYAGVVFAVGWLALKLAYFIFAVIYLRKDSVRRIFDAGTRP